MPTRDPASQAGALERLRELCRQDNDPAAVCSAAEFILDMVCRHANKAEAYIAIALMKLWHYGNIAGAEDTVNDALDAAADATVANPADDWLFGWALIMKAELRRSARDWHAAAELLEAAQRYAGEHAATQARVNLAWGRLKLGAWKAEDSPENREVLTHFTVAVHEARTAGDPTLLAWALLHRAFAMYCSGGVLIPREAMREASALLGVNPALTEAFAALEWLSYTPGGRATSPGSAAANTVRSLRALRI